MHNVVVGTLKESGFAREFANPMFRLRYSIFYERLQWDVSVIDGMERDEYDDSNAVYILVKNPENSLLAGCWRLRPTSTPYMLRDTFGNLLGKEPAPADSHVWEISRFACTNTPYAAPSYSFSDISLELIRASVRLAVERQISRYVMVTSVGVERMLRRLGLVVQRFSPPQRIGRVQTVACWVDIDEHTREVVLGSEPRRMQEAA